jgi:hypothetical protein
MPKQAKPKNRSKTSRLRAKLKKKHTKARQRVTKDKKRKFS